ncbi:MAG: NAD(P)-dependent oxidoreductase [Candidatus Babeliales bacterium]
MKIVFFELNEQFHDSLKQAFPHDELLFFANPLPEKIPNTIKDADVLSIFICSQVDAAILQQFSKLSFIAVRATGYNNVDIKVAQKRGIKVCNVPYYASQTVGEFTFALLLSLSRKINRAYYHVVYERSFSMDSLQGFDLEGKTLGVVGTGNIGKQVIRIAKAFAMNIIACDARPDTAYAQQMGFAYCSYQELCAQADIITFHVPLIKETKHMFNKETLPWLKKGIYIINTARGGIIQTDALVQGLEQGIIAGAGLDVVEEECYMRNPAAVLTHHADAHEYKVMLENDYLIHHPRVIITPHIAFNSREAVERLIKTTIENIKGWHAGTPCNLINEQ